MIAVFVV